MLLEVVVPFLTNGVITAKWGSTIQSYQVLELTIYETGELWDKRTGPLADLLRKRRNQFARFEAKAKKLLSKNVPRVFVVMPIQGVGGELLILAECTVEVQTCESFVHR